MATLKATTAPRFFSQFAAADAEHCLRKGEFDAALAGYAAADHEHLPEDVTGLDEHVEDLVAGMMLASYSVAWEYNDPANRLSATVRLKEDGGLDVDPGGVFVLFGSGPNEAARGDHDHGDSHIPLTVSSTDTIEHTLNGQFLTSEVRVVEHGALRVTDSGLGVDLGTNGNQAAYGNHGHAQLHNPATVESSDTLALEIVGQLISGAVRLKESPGVLGIALASDSEGIYIPTGDSGVAEHDHDHDLATTLQAGFMSAEDKRKLDHYEELIQVDHGALFHRTDPIKVGEHVGGRYRWTQDMEIVRANLTASAALAQAVKLALTIDDVETGDTLLIPVGAANSEVIDAANFSDLFIEAGAWARWLCVRGPYEVENSGSRIDLVMNVRPALANIPEFQINCGGASADPFSADANFDSGSAATTVNTIDVSAVSDPAPMAVYRSVRQKLLDATPLIYTIIGLGRNVNYAVRLHFADFFPFRTEGEQVFDISVIGNTTEGQAGFDIIALAGAPNKAVIPEFFLKPDANGQIVIKLQPVANGSGDYYCSINGIEVLQA
jgi:hypothetical protein